MISRLNESAPLAQDHPFALKAWKANLDLPYELLSDHKLAVANQYVGTIDLGFATVTQMSHHCMYVHMLLAERFWRE